MVHVTLIVLGRPCWYIGILFKLTSLVGGGGVVGSSYVYCCFVQ